MSLFHPHDAEAQPIEPVTTPFAKIDGAEIAALTVGERVAGDFYDSIRVSPERVLFGLIDVAGHRENNRDILNAAQEIFRNLGTELFSKADLNESVAMSELCLRINRHLIEVSKGVHSCPAFIACYHEKFGTLCYTNAGHSSGLLRDSTGIVELPSTGLPLGLFSHATCEAPTVGTAKGSALLLVSRGVVECSATESNASDDGGDGKSAEQFGLDRVKQLLAAAPSATAQDLCVSILKALRGFTSCSLTADNRTALAFVRIA